MSLRDQLQTIYEENGQLTPALVVETARPKDHPLHDRFEWDNRVAGEAWRREQAHELIRTARVVYLPATETGDERSVRAFHAVRGEEGYAYEPASAVAVDPFLRELVLRDMERDWQALKRRYAEFEEFTALIRKDVAA